MTNQSPLKKSLPFLKPLQGVLFGTAQTNSRYKNRDDLLLVYFESPASVGGVLTLNRCPGVPVSWCRKNLALKNPAARTLLVNAGNANVFTGQQGKDAAEDIAQALSSLLNIQIENVFLASTGVIGEAFPTDAILNNLKTAAQNLSPENWEKAARAIMTTDTFPKAAVRTAKIGGKEVTLQGFVKGSGMIAPNMATMLAYIFTDATIPSPVLQRLMQESSQKSFNAITVDSDTSTSDMALCFALHQVEHPVPKDVEDPLLADFREKMHEITKELALLVLRDGEGVTRLMHVQVTKSPSVETAREIAFSIANSPLVKTAIAGGDPNWGRIVMAIGKANLPVDFKKINISFCGTKVSEAGGCLAYDEALLRKKMLSEEISILVSLENGIESAEVWGCDLTKTYIDINASYRS